MSTPARLIAVCCSMLLTVAALALFAAGGGLAVASAPPSPLAGNYSVDSTADSPDADAYDHQCIAANLHCTLRAAISEANRLTIPATINLPAGTFLLTRPGYNEDNNELGDLDIKNDVTIKGLGPGLTIIDGNGKVTGDRVFEIFSNTHEISLTGLTIRGGAPYTSTVLYGESGGAIYLHGLDQLLFPIPVLHLAQDSIESNSAGNGAGIFAQGGRLILDNVGLYGNDARFDGGALSLLYGRLSINNSQFYSNSASSGGGLFLYAITAGSILQAALYSNTVTNDGGGAFVSGANASFSRTTIYANRAGRDGGGLWIDNISINVSSVRDSTLYANSASAGGAIYLAANPGSRHPVPQLLLTNSTVNGNHASHDGGGIYADVTADLGMFNVTLADNQATRSLTQHWPTRGGGIFITSTTTISVQNSLIANNVSGRLDLTPDADDCFGLLHSLDFNLFGTTLNCVFTGETAHNVVGRDPLLGPLQYNGGGTPTRALLLGSPAIDKGNPNGCNDNAGAPLLTDQRGFRRAINARCDIGAFEYSPFFLTLPFIRR